MSQQLMRAGGGAAKAAGVLAMFGSVYSAGMAAIVAGIVPRAFEEPSSGLSEDIANGLILVVGALSVVDAIVLFCGGVLLLARNRLGRILVAVGCVLVIGERVAGFVLVAALPQLDLSIYIVVVSIAVSIFPILTLVLVTR
jgi:hypothetical protein